MSNPSPRRRPTREELQAARDSTIPDVIAPGLRILFCGINPSLYSAATGFHFARPGNRFWPTLHAAGFTDRLLHPSEQESLIELGLGVTNVVARATATADELSNEELRQGGEQLRERVQRYRPRILAILGVGAYRIAFAQPKASLGLQPERIASTEIWVLPNPSGLNAHYQLADLTRIYAELRIAAHVPIGD